MNHGLRESEVGRWGFEWIPPAAAFLKLVVHLFGTHPAYGYFRDELYYLACADHLAWGYVDHPPLSITILAAVRSLLGDSLFALRLPVAIVGAVSILVSARMTASIGGGPFAQALAALCTLVMGVCLGFGTFYSMNPFDFLFCQAIAWVFIVQMKSPDQTGWIAWGALVGIGVLNKYNAGILAGGLTFGMLTIARRSELWKPGFLGGVVLAALLVSPHLIWQVSNGFPTLEFMANATMYKNVPMSPLQYLGAQVLEMNPITVPVWMAGLGTLLFGRSAKLFRPLGVAYLLLFTLFVVQHGKPYYLAAAYPMLFAAGALSFERWALHRPTLRVSVLGVVMLVGIALAPFAVPVLSPEAFVRYAAWTGIQVPGEERGAKAALPQLFADHFGWENLTAQVAKVYNALPKEERRGAAIFTRNYGEASALRFFGPKLGLPYPVSSHNNYWLWGPGGSSGTVLVLTKDPPEWLRRSFERVEVAAVIQSPWANPLETDLPIYICRGPRRPLGEMWAELKRFV